MIPKLIHYCWFGKKRLSSNSIRCINSWKKYCPDYEIIEWNEENSKFDESRFATKAFSEKQWAFVSDYMRLKIVYEHGGVYLDTDVELLRNIDFLLNEESFFGSNQAGKKAATGLGFGANKKNQIVLKMMEEYNNLEFDINNKESFVCPVLNTSALSKCGYIYSEEVVKYDGFTVYPPRFFDPMGTGDSMDLLSKDSVSIHHYSASWTSFQQRIKRKIAIMIGYKGEQIIKKARRAIVGKD